MAENIEETTLHGEGPIPGIGGGAYPPGRYRIDWDARTAMLVVTPLEGTVLPATKVQRKKDPPTQPEPETGASE